VRQFFFASGSETDGQSKMSVTAAGAKAASYTEALSEYLQGAEWRENVDYFISSNCSSKNGKGNPSSWGRRWRLGVGPVG